jgi:hypothetical protein
VYFKNLELDITDPDNYRKGIERFKQDIVGDLEVIKNDLSKSDLKIRMTMQKVENGIRFTVTNNTAILPEELERINLR